ncbi:MAG: hypothetical protein J7501_13885 [Bdellovibrio sp.]|nr:hypothetical protein [Bdellovibrio sp.]
MVYSKRTLMLLSLSIFALFAETAQGYVPQRGNVTFTLGPYVYRTNYDGILSENNPWESGISLVANGDVSDHGALEIAAIYMYKNYFREESGKAIAERAQLMHITVGYRRYWAPSFSTSLALYTSYPMGDTTTVHNDFTAADQMQTSGRSGSESGLDLALQGELWNSGRYAIWLETRYSYAIIEKSHEYSDQYGAMIGLRYFFQARVAKPKELVKPTPPAPPPQSPQLEPRK